MCRRSKLWQRDPNDRWQSKQGTDSQDGWIVFPAPSLSEYVAMNKNPLHVPLSVTWRRKYGVDTVALAILILKPNQNTHTKYFELCFMGQAAEIKIFKTGEECYPITGICDFTVAWDHLGRFVCNLRSCIWQRWTDGAWGCCLWSWLLWILVD